MFTQRICIDVEDIPEYTGVKQEILEIIEKNCWDEQIIPANWFEEDEAPLFYSLLREKCSQDEIEDAWLVMY